MDLKEIGWEGVELINLAQDRDKCWAIVNTLVNFIYLKSVHGEIFTRM